MFSLLCVLTLNRRLQRNAQRIIEFKPSVQINAHSKAARMITMLVSKLFVPEPARLVVLVVLLYGGEPVGHLLKGRQR